MRSSIAAAMAVTVFLAPGCALQGLSLRERVEQSEWLRVNNEYMSMWFGRQREYGETIDGLLLPEERPSPVAAYFSTLLNTSQVPTGQEESEAWRILAKASQEVGRYEQVGDFLDYWEQDPLLERIGVWMQQQDSALQGRRERHLDKGRAVIAAIPSSKVPRAEYVRSTLEIVEIIKEGNVIAGRANELQRLAADLRAHAEDVGRAEARDAAQWRAEQARWDAFSDWLRRQEERRRDRQLLDALRRPRTCFQAGQTITCY